VRRVPSGVGCSWCCLLLRASSSEASWGVLSARALPFFSASSAAFTASSTDGAAFELALLGAIAGGLFVARTVGAKCWYTLYERVNPTGNRRECLQGSTENGNSSVNLPPQEYWTGVFIGTRVPTVLRQGCLCPREPRVSSEYSPKGRLHTIITEKAIIDEARNTLIPAGPVTMGRIPHGLPDTMRT
jgi:hypothetical protein